MDGSDQQTENPHNLTSNVRQQADSISVFHNKRRPKLDLERYLQGRSYQLFKRGIKAERTRSYYSRNLYVFCEYLQMTTEEIVTKFGPFVIVKGKKRPNPEGMLELQRLIENYVLALQEKVEVGDIKPTTCAPLVAPIRLFCEMCDLTVNWKKISRLMPRSDLVASDEAYTHTQVKKMLEFCDLRARIIILFFASSGMRLGGLAGLKDGDVTPVYSTAENGGNEPAKVVCAHVVVYNGTEDRYDTFVTPEAWYAYAEYRALRIKYGEKITDESPVILGRFSPKSMREGRVKAVNYGTIRNIVAVVCHKAGIMEASKHYKDRFTIKRVHGFRKFWNTAVKSVRTPEGLPLIQHIDKERLLGHTLMNDLALEKNYDRGDLIAELKSAYLKAVPILTLSDEARLALQVTKLQEDVKTFKTLDVEVAQKDREIRDLQAQMKTMQESQDELKELLKHPEKIFELMTRTED